ncbi:hypothetical protein [Quadrisphaera setariae]|uniref:Uncharacterized protein n=1 Tax=Quadrisphaera setariae TaxID=2593304 RepID=A0A5C8Z4B4_9ACTN|nr:hypothetical protein [Quadrisphaera setariae]TXR51756.1 hypothetical protein FMM08_21055 [Quadrisphaera setariae]
MTAPAGQAPQDGPVSLPRTGDAAVDAALSPLRRTAAAPGEDPLVASRALAEAHDALRARLADAG